MFGKSLKPTVSLWDSLWASAKDSWRNRKTDLYHRWLLFRSDWGLLRMTDKRGKPTKQAIEVNRIRMTARAFGRFMDQAEMGAPSRGEDTTSSSTTGFHARKKVEGE